MPTGVHLSAFEIIKPTKWWSLNNSILFSDTQRERIGKEIKKYFDTNNNCGVLEPIIWDAFKATLRGVLISIGTHLRKDKKKQL